MLLVCSIFFLCPGGGRVRLPFHIRRLPGRETNTSPIPADKKKGPADAGPVIPAFMGDLRHPPGSSHLLLYGDPEILQVPQGNEQLPLVLLEFLILDMF